MDEDQWTYDYMMSQEVHMDYDNEEELLFVFGGAGKSSTTREVFGYGC